MRSLRRTAYAANAWAAPSSSCPTCGTVSYEAIHLAVHHSDAVVTSVYLCDCRTAWAEQFQHPGMTEGDESP